MPDYLDDKKSSVSLKLCDIDGDGAVDVLAVDALGGRMAAVEVPRGILTAFLAAPVVRWWLASARRGWQ